MEPKKVPETQERPQGGQYRQAVIAVLKEMVDSYEKTHKEATALGLRERLEAVEATLQKISSEKTKEDEDEQEDTDLDI